MTSKNLVDQEVWTTLFYRYLQYSAKHNWSQMNNHDMAFLEEYVLLQKYYKIVRFKVLVVSAILCTQ